MNLENKEHVSDFTFCRSQCLFCSKEMVQAPIFVLHCCIIINLMSESALLPHLDNGPFLQEPGTTDVMKMVKGGIDARGVGLSLTGVLMRQQRELQRLDSGSMIDSDSDSSSVGESDSECDSDDEGEWMHKCKVKWAYTYSHLFLFSL